MRKVAAVCCFFLVLLLSVTALAAERQPQRIAQFPLVIESWQQPSSDVQDELEAKIDRALHVPLNDTLKAVEYIPEKNCLAAWDEVESGLTGKARIKDMAKPIAEKLNADLVVIPVVAGYEQYTTMSWYWDHDMILHSYAEIQLVVYDRTTDKLVYKKSSDFYDDEYSTTGTASYLARSCMDNVIRDANLHGFLWPLDRNTFSKDTK
ncbi:hypothetical protein [uncultured Mitsuokella sp.]|uniref:hypothetical protein n=1 Tax=uncultured Mitsuokella sp. TaxID=453120 RepID=UPI0025FC4869|nr:hypothetical protein [uncultured Mitsuokella sp.]